MARKGKLIVLGVLVLAVINTAMDISLTTALSRGFACTPSQQKPLEAQIYTTDLFPAAALFVILECIATFGLHLPGAIRAIRDDEVYDVDKPKLRYFGLLAYTMLGDVPMFLLQLVLFFRVGVPTNFFLAKMFFSLTSLFSVGWHILLFKLDRHFGVGWGPFREHPWGTTASCSGCWGIVFLCVLGFLWPTPLPTGLDIERIDLLARPVPIAGCVYTEPLQDNLILHLASQGVDTINVANSPTDGGDFPDYLNARSSPMRYQSVFGNLSTAKWPFGARMAVLTGRVWATRTDGDMFSATAHGSVSIEVEATRRDGIIFKTQFVFERPLLYERGYVTGTLDTSSLTYWYEEGCFDITVGDPVLQSCSVATCDPGQPTIQVGLFMEAKGHMCTPF